MAERNSTGGGGTGQRRQGGNPEPRRVIGRKGHYYAWGVREDRRRDAWFRARMERDQRMLRAARASGVGVEAATHAFIESRKAFQQAVHQTRGYNVGYEEEEAGRGLTPSQKGAHATLEEMLQQWGLAGLGQGAWERYLHGEPVDQIMAWIRGTHQYKERFPAMAALEREGIAMSEADYINYEQQAITTMHSYGVPAGIYDSHAELGKLIAGQVSISELGSRLQLASEATTTAPLETRQALQRLYGIHSGELTAYWLNPNKNLQVLTKRYNAATLAGAGAVAGYGDITRDQAQHLANAGISEDSARTAFGNLAHLQQLFGQLPGQAGAPDISRGEQLGAEFFNNATDQQMISNAAAAQRALNGPQGGAAATTSGATGEASAQKF